jgi:hypothetical protein
LAPYSFAVAKHALDCMQEWHTPVRALAFELGRVPIYLAQETDMSVEAHLAELERRHRALEAEIAEARGHPSIDDLQIVELKRRKLLLKDEITRLQN